MRLDKLLLSRFQIHILLCVLPMDIQGMVDVAGAVQICVTMIQRFFNPCTMYATATKIQQDMEQEAKEKELRELQEASGQRRSKTSKEEAEAAGFIDLAQRDNKDELERNLMSLFQSVDEDKSGAIPISNFLKQLYTDWESTLSGGGLTEAEKHGFIGECVQVNENRVYYANHVRTWVPLLFEFRKNTFYKQLLEVENAFMGGNGTIQLIELLDLTALEKEMPLFGGGALGRLSKNTRKRRTSKSQLNLGSKEASGSLSMKGSKGASGAAGGTGSRRTMPGGVRGANLSKRGSKEMAKPPSK